MAARIKLTLPQSTLLELANATGVVKTLMMAITMVPMQDLQAPIYDLLKPI
jgi:hypothetical protein